MPGHSPPRGHTAGWPELGPPGLTPNSLCPGMGLGRAGLLTGTWMPVIWTIPVSSHCTVPWGTSISFPLVSSRLCKESPTLDSCLRPCSIRENTGEKTGLLSHSGMCRAWVRGPVSALVTPRVDLHHHTDSAHPPLLSLGVTKWHPMAGSKTGWALLCVLLVP